MRKITNWNRRELLQAGAATALLPVAGAAFAQAGYPDRAIKVVVPYPPGGNTDVIARDVAKGLSARLGQPVVIENKPGANSILGTDLVAKAPADGHTLLVVIGAYANNQALYRNLPYSPEDFAPVSLLTRTSLVVTTGLPHIRSMADLVREGTGKEGMTFASSGVGSAAHLLGERFARTARLKGAMHVPYKGSTDALNDLIAGRVSFMFDAVAAVGTHFRSGRLTPLAVTGDQRSPLLPNVPTLRELGYDMVASAWAALLAPARTPAPIVERLAAESAQVLRDPELRARLANISTDAVGSTPAELKSFLASEVKVNGDLIRQLGISMERQ